MAIIKRKSLVVVLVSSLVLCVALLITVFSYLFYISLKDSESRAAYQHRSSVIVEKYSHLHRGIKR